MTEYLDKLFGISELGIAQGRNIPKNTFYTHEYFKTAEKRLFTSDIDTFTLIALANEQNTNIAPVKNDTVRYEEVFFIHVVLREENKAITIAEIIHDVIPNPCVVILTHNQRFLVSTAPKRLSKNEQRKVVIEQYIHAPWVDTNDMSDVEQQYAEQLHLKNMRFDTLEHFYHDICKVGIYACFIEFLGQFCYSKQVDLDTLTLQLQQYRELVKKQQYHQNQEKQLSHFGDKVANHRKLLDTQKQLQALKQKISNTQ
jgi:hypothetical protein